MAKKKTAETPQTKALTKAEIIEAYFAAAYNVPRSERPAVLAKYQKMYNEAAE